jgi:ATP-dependent exoDNAse (exonuclease V) alpha subunit
MDKYLDVSPTLIKIKGYITRQEIFKEELDVIEFVNNGKDAFSPLNKDYKAFNSAEHILNEKEKGYDYKEQRKVIETVLQNKDRAVIIRGLAGAGKTTAVAELDAGLKSVGKEAFYYAPQTGAVEAFSNEEYFKNAGRAAGTVASLIFRAKNKELKELNNKTLVIDEAGQLSAQSGKALINIAEKYNCKLIFVGDSKQHNAVDRGDFMRIIEEYSDITKVELRGIRRQRNKEHLKAVYDLADGKAAKGLERIDKLGWITEDKNYLKVAADKYLELRNNKAEFNDIISISPTHREGEKFTEYIRNGLLENGILSDGKVDRLRFKSKNLTEERKKHIKNYNVGQALSFREKSGSFNPNDTRVIKEIKSNHVILSDGNKFYPIKSGRKIDIGVLKKVDVRKGDLIRPTANNKKINLINGKLYEVKSIENNKKSSCATIFPEVS